MSILLVVLDAPTPNSLPSNVKESNSKSSFTVPFMLNTVASLTFEL